MYNTCNDYSCMQEQGVLLLFTYRCQQSSVSMSLNFPQYAELSESYQSAVQAIKIIINTLAANLEFGPFLESSPTWIPPLSSEFKGLAHPQVLDFIQTNRTSRRNLCWMLLLHKLGLPHHTQIADASVIFHIINEKVKPYFKILEPILIHADIIDEVKEALPAFEQIREKSVRRASVHLVEQLQSASAVIQHETDRANVAERLVASVPLTMSSGTTPSSSDPALLHFMNAQLKESREFNQQQMAMMMQMMQHMQAVSTSAATGQGGQAEKTKDPPATGAFTSANAEKLLHFWADLGPLGLMTTTKTELQTRLKYHFSSRPIIALTTADEDRMNRTWYESLHRAHLTGPPYLPPHLRLEELGLMQAILPKLSGELLEDTSNARARGAFNANAVNYSHAPQNSDRRSGHAHEHSGGSSSGRFRGGGKGSGPRTEGRPHSRSPPRDRESSSSAHGSSGTGRGRGGRGTH